MLKWDDRKDLKVALLYNLDPEWDEPNRKAVEDETMRLVDGLRENKFDVDVEAVTDSNVGGRIRKFDPARTIIFNWCECLPGIPGSEAMVADIIDFSGFIYTGSSGRVISVSENKGAVKQLLADAKVPTPEWRIYDNTRVDDWTTFPAIVKSACQHCSAGITSASVVMNTAELRKQVEYMLETFGDPVLIEDFIDGREFHVSMWGNGDTEMLPPVEMDFSRLGDIHRRLCTYDSKFTEDSADQQEIDSVIPANLTPEENRALRQACEAGYAAVGCRDYGRLDIRLRDGVFYVLDINPNADLSSEASMAAAAEHIGYSFGQMGGQLLKFAAHRHRRFASTVRKA